MNRLFKILTVLFITLVIQSLAFAQDDDDVVVVGSVPAAGGCDPATNEVGNRGEGASTEDFPAGASFCFLATPDCSGTLKQAYFDNCYQIANHFIKIGVYLDDGDNAPDSGDTVVGCSSTITTTAVDEWVTVAETIGGAVSTGSNYWVCVHLESVVSNQRVCRTGTGTGFYKTGTGWYATPPAALDSMTSINENGDFYVSVE